MTATASTTPVPSSVEVRHASGLAGCHQRLLPARSVARCSGIPIDPEAAVAKANRWTARQAVRLNLARQASISAFSHTLTKQSRAGMDLGEPPREWAGRPTCAGPGPLSPEWFAIRLTTLGSEVSLGKPWLDMQNKEKPRRSGAQLAVAAVQEAVCRSKAVQHIEAELSVYDRLSLAEQQALLDALETLDPEDDGGRLVIGEDGGLLLERLVPSNGEDS